MTPQELAKSGSEDGEQTALFAYALQPGYAQAGPYGDLWAMLFAIPNGGLRSPATAARMVAMGARRGYPDIGLDVARGPYHGLRIELKRSGLVGRKPAGVVSDDQRRWHILLHGQGYCVEVCYGWEHAVTVIEWYIRGSQL